MSTNTLVSTMNAAEIVTFLNGAGVDHADFENFESSMFYPQVEQVADALHLRIPEFTFAFECDSEGGIRGATIGHRLNDPSTYPVLYTVKWVEYSDLSGDLDATGTEQAVAITKALLDTYEFVNTSRTDALPSSPVWPDNDTERARFADWQYEVANGDTAVGFRDWLTSQSED